MKKLISTIVTLSISMTLISQVAMHHITAFYPLDGDAGDSSGNGLHGQVLGPVGTTDRFGNPDGALLFDGVNDYVELNSNNPIITQDSFTIAFWVKLHGQGGGVNSQNMTFSQRSNTTAAYNTVANIFMDNGSGDFTYNLRSDANPTGERIEFPTNTFNYNQWYHIACTYSSYDVAAVYVNGDLMYARPYNQTGNFVGGVDYVSLGRHRYFDTDYGFLNGAIDELRIYSTALHEQQIDSLYRGLSTGIDHIGFGLESIRLLPNITTTNAPISISIPATFPLSNEVSMHVYDTKGRLIQSVQISESRMISFESKGIYLVELCSEEVGRIFCEKVIVQ